MKSTISCHCDNCQSNSNTIVATVGVWMNKSLDGRWVRLSWDEDWCIECVNRQEFIRGGNDEFESVRKEDGETHYLTLLEDDDSDDGFNLQQEIDYIDANMF